MSFSKRILLKISGESLMGESNYGLDIMRKIWEFLLSRRLSCQDVVQASG